SFADANLPEETLRWLADNGALAVDAISVAKSRKLRGILGKIALLFATTMQAAEIGDSSVVRCRVVTTGASGITVWVGDDRRAMAVLPATPKNVTGAGDALVAGTLYGMTEGLNLFEAARFGLAAAAITVEAQGTIAEDLTVEMLRSRM
ncbi:MAG TPA: PfkB family carbohydrate kinase, partial [Candidatus Solibacter sp.]|nr:PfkB family carbohydrate kinase [Candidatus Solibacter sp.]